MAQPVLYMDARNAVNGKTSKIHMDNPIAIHTFISDWIKTLPKFAGNGDALANNLKVGDLYNNTLINAVSYVVL